MLGKGIKRALGEELNGKRKLLCLRLRLHHKLGMKVLKCRRKSRIPVLLIVPVHSGRASVNNGLLLGSQITVTYKLLAQ